MFIKFQASKIRKKQFTYLSSNISSTETDELLLTG